MNLSSSGPPPKLGQSHSDVTDVETAEVYSRTRRVMLSRGFNLSSRIAAISPVEIWGRYKEKQQESGQSGGLFARLALRSIAVSRIIHRLSRNQARGTSLDGVFVWAELEDTRSAKDSTAFMPPWFRDCRGCGKMDDQAYPSRWHLDRVKAGPSQSFCFGDPFVQKRKHVSSRT